jgi:F0F1-type ATP synthase membrane subunit b/b'
MPRPGAREVPSDQLEELQRLVDELTHHNGLAQQAVAAVSEASTLLQDTEKQAASAISQAQEDLNQKTGAAKTANEAVKNDIAAINEFMATLTPPEGKK